MSSAPFDLGAYISSRTRLVQSGLERFVPGDGTPSPSLHEAMRYSLFGGGKRIRPLLCMAAAEAVGGSAEQVVPTACALEMIHTFSLIHDDLPAIDNDDFRRGSLTSHQKFGEAMAILAGDALNTHAFLTIAHHQKAQDPGVVLRVIELIADASGTAGMVGGQVDDIYYEGRDVDAATLRRIHMRKTGALLSASILSGAMLAGMDDAQERNLREYGDQVGLAFQIVDDILDVTGDEDKLGKPTGSDMRKDKATYPRVFGLARSKELAREAALKASCALTDWSPAAEPLRAFARFIVEREV